MRALLIAVACLLASTALAQDPAPPPTSAPAPAPVPGPAPPTEAELTRAVARLLARHSDASACQPPTVEGSELRYTCTDRECPGACQVVDHIVVIAYRRGHFRRLSDRREHRGDTGACGCCIDGYE